jgi:hypothetical protein
LLEELRQCENLVYRYTRMTKENFEKLLEVVGPNIEKGYMYWNAGK